MSIVRRLQARSATVGGLSIQRLLPQAMQRKVGPWVFLDHFGPVEVVRSRAHDVRPHPHCGLSTVTFLFDGAIEHRDSTGGHVVVQPGEVHWMRAGHGIAHSERVPADRLGTLGRTHGLQLWCAHPDGEEEQEPRFDSYRELPTLDVDGVPVQLLAGTGWGAASPVDVTSPLVYAIAEVRAGQRLELPDHEERCVVPVSGSIALDGEVAGEHELLVSGPGRGWLQATHDAVVAILGGAPIGPRHMWWNLVHSDRERLREQAARYRGGDYPRIPGDETFMEAPETGP